MKIVTVVGARPQFIKAAPVSRELRKNHEEILVHTGQHYDKNMSDIFFEELNIPKPDYNLNVGSGHHGKQTGEMLMKIEEVLLNEKSDAMLVYGDTNSTLAGALAASKLHIPVIHIEAGLRSYNMHMPEEQNRILTDHLATMLFCPTQNAVDNLAKEGITKGVYNVGDVMLDALLYNLKIAEIKSNILADINVAPQKYILATIHRAENTDNIENLTNIFKAFSELEWPIIVPLHPRTRNIIKNNANLFAFINDSNIKIIEPLAYLDMIMAMKHAKIIMTDSGGVQKEAYFLKTPCITLRTETEWIETVESGWNILSQSNSETIKDAASMFKTRNFNTLKHTDCYGNGDASRIIGDIIEARLK
ncbi:non-hydrolyzing UDP-N-acetylglucosamine 2-epimerase [Lutispora saccharofermentans]|uniref:UDP-N-acetylglucosamine 2-epimerase (Non-hydrolyzing) n=1 Tax=Lutispora saccharofermentans TaxID=3024236 RepID=A0ABT1ND15_9FIRM|nr:UDP-N-acetylglucosamine 2-epimerase (non-hydrolyzing) [Lutispora saccharofermentans]MCQ1529157.1 UDP-N-acetylglucosamine 2-epimerase (non-hydrolyzing) [Lutispora saccharofermentans]